MPIKYIIPDWDDYLDANFDFINDSFSEPAKEKQFIYLHEMMGEATPYDGILVSLNQIDKKKGALKNHTNHGVKASIREIMRVPENIKIFGDCGAFTYKDQASPAIKPEEAAKLYHEYGFDIGASVDHMIIDSVEKNDDEGNKIKHILTDAEKNQRVKLTVDNAESFINSVKINKYDFIPLGSIQAITAKQYADIFDKYIEMGYRQVALGSLIPKNDDQIREIILAVGERYRALKKSIRNEVGIHLFGVLRPALFSLFEQNGITSFDSASYFRKAWLKSDKNYLGTNNVWYPAIRVPQSNLPRNRNALIEAGHDLAKVAKLEKEVLRRLNNFTANDNIEEILDIIIKYDTYYPRISDSGEKLRDSYRRVLTDRPWEQCNCTICQNVGINTLIFRGYNRNKRRGFHNTYVFYNQLLGGNKNELK